MAENKKSFILYCDILATFENLTDDEAGKLMKHLLRYVNDLNPEPIDRVTGLLFEPIKQQLKRDLEKWSNERKGRSDAGKKGMEKRWADHNKQKQDITKDNTVIENITNITDNVSVSVSVNVSDSVSVNKDEIKLPKKDIVAKKPLPTTEYSSIVDFWLKDFHAGWTFSGAQGKAVKSIIKKLQSVFPDNDVVEIFKMMCLKLPEWFKDKDLLVIDSKLNEILEQIKNNQNGNKKNIDSNGKPLSKYDPAYQH